MARESRWRKAAWVLACLLALGGCRQQSSSGDSKSPTGDDPPLSNGSDAGRLPVQSDVDAGPLPHEPDAGTPSEPDGGTNPDVDAGTEPLPPRDAAAVRKENQRPGTTEWRLTRTANNREIEGYALQTTVRQGETLRVAVSVAEAKDFRWYVYRLGYYGGAGGREVARGGPVHGVKQAACPPDPTTGVVACDWAVNLEIPVGDDWVRGVYVVKLVRDDSMKHQRYVPFFVRDADMRAQVAVLMPTATWAAYNTWGGTSLYDDPNRVMKAYGVARAFQSSYDRPYYRGQGSGHLMTDDRSLVQWLESQDLDVAYFTNEDLDEGYDVLAGAKVLILSGHDEYWSTRNRDFADKALAEGRSLLNLGANNAYWHVRLEPSKDGRPRRVVTCYKGHESDPFKDARRTVKFRDPPVSRPENALLGVMFAARWHQFGFPSVITAPDHWALAGTGLRAGDTLWMTNGYELDQVVSNGRTPSGVEVLAESPALSLQGAFGFSHMVVRQQGGAYVFSAGGIDFVRALSDEAIADPRAARIVANVLYKALGRPVPESLVAFKGEGPARAQGPYAEKVTTVAGKPGHRASSGMKVESNALGAPVAVAVHPGGGWVVADALANAVKRVTEDGKIQTLLTSLNAPMGIAVDAAGNIYVADSDSALIRRIAPDGHASVFAGSGYGAQDGPAREAAFNQPAGLSLTPDGTALLVADLGNGLLRRIDLVAEGHPVTTLKGDWLYRPSAVAMAPDGTVYAVESGMARVVRVRDGVTKVIAGSSPGFRDGDPDDARFLPYLGLAVLPDGSLAVSDPGNYRVRRVLLDSGGGGRQVTTLAGSGRYGADDGPGEDARLVLPAGLAVGPDGRLYVADSGNSLIRAITP